MSTTTTRVHRSDWSSYFERLMTELPTTWVSIDVEAEGIGHQVEARDLRLEGFSYDSHDDAVEISAFRQGPDSKAVLRHVIQRPNRINVESADGALPTAVEIVGADGIRTLVSLRGAPALAS